MNTNFEVIGLTRLGIKSKSTPLEADAFTTRPSELLKCDLLLSTTVSLLMGLEETRIVWS